MSSIVLCCFPVSPFTKALYIHCRLKPSINALHCPLSITFLFHLSPRLCTFAAGCSPPSMSSIVLCLLLSCFTFHLGFVHPLQAGALHQCPPLPSVCCFPVSPFTKALSIYCSNVALHQCLQLSSVCCFPVPPFTQALYIHCRLEPSINALHCPLSLAFLSQVVPSFLAMSSLPSST